jgi:hypothetical protein
VPLSGLAGAMNLRPLRANPGAAQIGAASLTSTPVTYDYFGGVRIIGSLPTATIRPATLQTDSVFARTKTVWSIEEPTGTLVSPETSTFELDITLPNNLNPTGWTAPGIQLTSRVVAVDVGVVGVTVALTILGGSGASITVFRTVVAPDAGYVVLSLPAATINAASARFQPGDQLRIRPAVTYEGPPGSVYEVRLSTIELGWVGVTP